MAIREILFKAKLADEDTWVEGSLVVWKGDTMIYTDRGFPHFMGNFLVEPETVGQFTGLTDKNGVKIFEGDIVAYDVEEEGVRYTDYAVIEWSKNGMRYAVKWGRGYADEWLKKSDESSFRVAGNIHDNPELIGGADNG